MRPPGPALTPKPRGTPAPASRAAAPRRREPATARAAPMALRGDGGDKAPPAGAQGRPCATVGVCGFRPCATQEHPGGRKSAAADGAVGRMGGPVRPACHDALGIMARGGSFDGGARWHVHLLQKRARDAGVRKAAGCQRPERGIACQPWQAQPQKQASAQPCARGGDWRLWRLIKGRAGPVADPAAFPQAGSKGASHGGIKARPWGDDVF